MKAKLLLIAVPLLSAWVGAFATTLGPCPTDASSANLTFGFSCPVGGKMFSDFGYNHSGTLGLSANEIGVIPTSEDEFGFDFFAAWKTFTGFTSDSRIAYTVTSGAEFLTSDAALTIAGFGVFGPAQVSLADTFSNGANPFIFFNPSCGAPHNCVTTDNPTFAGVLSLSQTPEPASLAVLGTSLLGLGYLIRKKKKLFTA